MSCLIWRIPKTIFRFFQMESWCIFAATVPDEFNWYDTKIWILHLSHSFSKYIRAVSSSTNGSILFLLFVSPGLSSTSWAKISTDHFLLTSWRIWAFDTPIREEPSMKKTQKSQVCEIVCLPLGQLRMNIPSYNAPLHYIWVF